MRAAAVRLYQYVGSKGIAARAGRTPAGVVIRDARDVVAWLRGQQRLGGGRVIATYVVDAAGALLVADRHSEHVACAGGGPVRCAGEMTFAFVGSEVEVVEVSNQSTGYCPEPAAWPEVAEALRRAGLRVPAGFVPECVFRRCEGCDVLNVVKGGAYECAACGAELPQEYNVQRADPA